ncbi:MAG: ligand-binding sensor domain-containing protein, partial [Flavisolibacter sp.]
MKSTLLSFFIFLIAASSCPGQILPHEKYTTKNGLMSDRVTAIAQDAKGFMWFGTFFGICRYDGMKFEKIALPPEQENKYVNGLLTLGEKVYASFLFGGGLAESDRGRVRSYFVSGTDSAMAREFTSIGDGGNGSVLLCTSTNQVFVFKNGVFKFLNRLNIPPSSTRNILKDKDQNIWVATESGLFVLPPPYQSAKLFFSNKNIFSLIKDEGSDIWFVVSDAGSSNIHKAKSFRSDGTLNETIVAKYRYVIPVNFSGNISKGLWGLDEKGLFNYDGQKTNRHKIPLDLTTSITGIYSDRENNIWIANEPGIVKVSNFNIQSFLFDEIAPGGGAIWQGADSIIWVSNSKSLYSIENSIIEKKMDIQTDNPDYYGLLNVDRSNNLWIGFWNKGLWKTKWADGKMKSKKDFSVFGKRSVLPRSIIEDSKGNIWIAGVNGIFRIKGDRIIENYHPKNKMGQPAFISCMAIDEKNNSIWLGDNAAGIIKVKYSIGPKETYTYAVEEYIGNENGLKDAYVRSILLDHNNIIWVGTRYGGIYRIIRNKEKTQVIDCNNQANLTCTRVTDIKEQDTTALWFASCDGIYRYHFASDSWSHYNTSNGLLNAEVFNLWIDAKNDVVWSLTAEGVTKLQIHDVDKPISPLINLTAITVLGKSDTAAINATTEIKYSNNQNSIGFSYAGASFIDEKRIRYKYMLEGHDKGWSEPVKTTSVNYVSLKPGNYVFKVIAENAKGQWSASPASFAFEIVLPFYKQPWFIFIGITLGIFLLYLARIQQLKQRFKIEKLRLSIARDLHDDVGATLGSINILSKTATRKMKQDAASGEIIPIFEKIGTSAENTLEAMDDIVWSINPDKDKLYDLIIRMREYAIPLFETNNMSFHFKVDGDEERVIPMNIRRNVFLIYKEAIHNILKHSTASEVDISLD